MEAESENSSSDSDDESNTRDDQVKIDANDKQKATEEPISKRHKPVNETQDQDGNVEVSNASSIQTVPARSLAEMEYAALKSDLRLRKMYLTRMPRIRVRDDGMKATIDLASENKIPLFMKDVQHMLAYFLFGPYLKPYNSSPRWCLIEKFNKIENVNLIVAEGLSIDDYLENESSFKFLNKHFSVKVEVISSYTYDGDVISDLSAVCISDNDRASLLHKFGTEEEILAKEENVFRLFKPAFPVKSPPVVGNASVPDKFPRTYLLLSLWQMVVESYPVPIKGELSEKYARYKLTKDVYQEVSDTSPLFGIDCEMCQTTAKENELARVTIVNEKSEVVYESLVKPYNKITDHLTKFSGITEEMLRNVDKRLEDVQNDIINLLPADAILVGHSLNIDLHALKIMHPYVIDTSVIYNISGERWRKPKLQTLAWEFLKLQIQRGNKGHDSAEDSISSLKLVQLKLSQNVCFGDAVMVGRQHLTDKDINSISKKEEENTCSLATSIFNSLSKENKRSIIISTPSNIERYRKYVTSNDENCHLLNVVDGNRWIMRQAYKSVEESKLTIAHLTFDHDNIGQDLPRLDRWCKKLWLKCKDNSVSIVLFTGSRSNPSNAVCFVEMKKPFLQARKPKLES
ncbi:RNA exonuclease 5 isoform X2 [Planococcus citri]